MKWLVLKPWSVVSVLLTASLGSLEPPGIPVHECTRSCHDNETPRTCRYRWVLENYSTLSRACYACPGNQTDCRRQECVAADGIVRSIRTANRRVPGPSIQVCEGDVIEVEVVNRMVMGEGVTLHWHGIHQRRHQHMDGVAMVTQCPIPAFSSFTYRFSAEDAGTHLWHAHSGLLLADGLFGPVVIRQSPSREPHTRRYDVDSPDHVIVLNDWAGQPIVSAYTQFYHEHGSKEPRSVLINGRGRLYSREGEPVTNTPLAEFTVKDGLRYRFRVIGAGVLKCPLLFSVDSHVLEIIASDGRPVEPFEVESLEVYTGERYDFVLKYVLGSSGQRREDTFFVRARGLLDCQPGHVQQVAILRYVSEVTAAMLANVKVNPPSNTTTTTTAIKATPTAGLRSVEGDDVSLTRNPDVRVYLQLQVLEVDNPHFYNPQLYPAGGAGYPPMFSTQINGISNVLPPAPLLTQMWDLDQSFFCNSSTVDPDCARGRKFCECLHRLTVPLGSVVELVIVSQSNAHTTSHPVHMHGHSFRVVAMERLEDPMTVERFKELDGEGKIRRVLHKAPYKDTLPVLDGGYAVLRLLADNPGVWYLHCHLSFHLEIGMSLYLHVPDHDGSLPPPPPDFPQCGPWQPGVSRSQGALPQPQHQHQPVSSYPTTALPVSSPKHDHMSHHNRPTGGDQPSSRDHAVPSSAPGSQPAELPQGNATPAAWVIALAAVLGSTVVLLVVALLVQRRNFQRRLQLRYRLLSGGSSNIGAEHYPLLLDERQ